MPHLTHEATGVRPFSIDPDFDFEIRTALGHSGQGAEIGEVLAATSGIRPSDHDAWFQAWHGLGERADEIARLASVGGHRVSAADAFLRASAYYAVAVNALSALGDTGLLLPAFRRQQAAWDGFIAHTTASVSRVDIPYEESSLPGWFFRAPRTGGAAQRAVIVAVNGSDGSLASLWADCVHPALARGYDVLIFDGPGQQSQLFERGTTFRPDWEHVLTPVYEFLSAIPGIDPTRIALYGVSQGGFWVARAIAFEHRFAAAVTDPGVVDVSASWTAHIPRSLLKTLESGHDDRFDREMAFGMRFAADTERSWRFRARPYGTKGYAETLRAVQAYDVRRVARNIVTPLLILSPEGEQFWPGQAEELASLTPGSSTLLTFRESEGAGDHCQPLARGLTAQRMFDWLDDRFAS